MPIEARIKLSNSKKGRSARNKKIVYQYDSEMNLIKQFESLAETSKQICKSPSALSTAIKKSRMVDGFYFTYKEDTE